MAGCKEFVSEIKNKTLKPSQNNLLKNTIIFGFKRP